MSRTTEGTDRRQGLLAGFGAACALVAAWQLVFGLLVSWGEGGSLWVAAVLPPLAAMTVPLGYLTWRGWWREPWLARFPGTQVVAPALPLLVVDALMVSQAGSPPGTLVVAFFVTSASEELLARGVVQSLLAGLHRVLQVLLSGGLLALGYVVTLTLLGLEASHTAYIAGMVLCFGVAHAALRRRGAPVPLLALLGGLVVWPQFARDAFDPLTALACLIALVYGVWMTLDETDASRVAA